MAKVSEIIGLIRLKGGKQFDRDLKKRVNTAKSSLRGLQSAFAAATAVVGFKSLLDAMKMQEQAEQRVQAAIRSTGGAAGVTADELKKMASSLQSVTTFGDEAILQAQALLLTFTQIGKDSFPQATEAVLNVAAAMQTDLKTAAVQVGKALNDPILGMTALSRSGIQFTEQQKEQVKILVESGKVFEAQGIIFQELETQFGGMARALAETDSGKLQQLQNEAGDVAEKFGEVALKIALVIGKALRPLVEWLNNSSLAVRNFVVSIGLAAGALRVLTGAITRLLPALGPVGWLALGLTAVTAIFVGLESQVNKTASGFNHLNKEISVLSLTQAKTRLVDVREELEKLAEFSEKANKGLTSFGSVDDIGDREDQRLLLENEQKKLISRIKLLSAQRTGEVKAQTEKEKELEENRIRFLFSTREIDRDDFIQYLKQRKTDFIVWSKDWINIQREINEQEIQLQKSKDAELLERSGVQTAAITAKRKEIRERELQDELSFQARMQDTVRANLDSIQAFLDESSQKQEMEDEQSYQNRLQKTQEFVSGFVDLMGNLGNSIGQAFASLATGETAGIKDFFKSLLNDTLEFVKRFYILAKIKTLIEGAISPISALKSAAPLIAAFAAISAAQGSIASFADGGVVNRPTLAIVGDSTRGPEIIAPKQDFLAHSDRLIQEALQINNGRRDVKIVQNFNTPMQDRRTARHLTNKTLRPELRRERKREQRFINETAT